MIILDTNVISELMKPAQDPRVVRWLDSQLTDALFVTSIVYAELRNGIELLPDGKRKRNLLELLNDIVTEIIEGRVIAFDMTAAIKFAEINRIARSKGVSVGFADCQIAAAALVNGFAVATRDEVPFKAMGVTVINPWIA